MIVDFFVDNKGREIAYDGNSTLKKCKCILPYTLGHINEMHKCKNDWKYFAENYYHITSLDEGVIKIKTRYYQDNIINNFINERFNIILSSRQSGKSTCYEVFCLWYSQFHESKTIAILANKLETAVGILSKIKMAYELLPNFLKQGVKKWNEKSVEFENGCKIIASATSSSAIRSKSVNVLILDEMGFVPTKQWIKFYSSVYPTISSSQDSKIIIVSTPNGLNQFYKFWTEALLGKDSVGGKGNKFKPYRVDWWEVPNRDEKWKQETIANTSQKEFDTEYGNSFLGSAKTLIETETLIKLTAKVPLNLNSINNIPTSLRQFLNIYYYPQPDSKYVMSIDAAKMTETSNGDSISIQVLDISNIPLKQVCTVLIEEGLSYLAVPELAIWLGELYNNATMFIENNEGSGQSIADNIIDLDYNNVYFQKPNIAGYRTDKKTKSLGCSNIKLLIEKGFIELNDDVTIKQLSTFVKHKNSYKADVGYNDDAVMSLIGGIFFMQDKDFDGIDKMDFVNGTINKTEEETDSQIVYGIDDDIISADLLDLEDTSWMLDR